MTCLAILVAVALRWRHRIRAADAGASSATVASLSARAKRPPVQVPVENSPRETSSTASPPPVTGPTSRPIREPTQIVPTIPPLAVLTLNARVPTSELKPRGDATALAAVETWVDAALNEQRDRIPPLIKWSSTENAHALFTLAPPSAKAHVSSPEDLVAWAATRRFADVGALELIEDVVVDPSEEIVGLRLLHANGNVTENTFHMRLSNGHWQRVVLATFVRNALISPPIFSSVADDLEPPHRFADDYSVILTGSPKPIHPGEMLRKYGLLPKEGR